MSMSYNHHNRNQGYVPSYTSQNTGAAFMARRGWDQNGSASEANTQISFTSKSRSIVHSRTQKFRCACFQLKEDIYHFIHHAGTSSHSCYSDNHIICFRRLVSVLYSFWTFIFSVHRSWSVTKPNKSTTCQPNFPTTHQQSTYNGTSNILTSLFLVTENVHFSTILEFRTKRILALSQFYDKQVTYTTWKTRTPTLRRSIWFRMQYDTVLLHPKNSSFLVG